MAEASTDCADPDATSESDSAAAYVDGASNYSDETNATVSTPIASRMSFLPYLIAATVASMFIILYVWKKKRDEQQLRNEDLLADEEASFHGSVAKRLERANSAVPTPLASPAEDAGITGYALA